MKKTVQNPMKSTLAFLLVLALTAAIFVQTANAQVTVTGSAGSAEIGRAHV